MIAQVAVPLSAPKGAVLSPNVRVTVGGETHDVTYLNDKEFVSNIGRCYHIQWLTDDGTHNSLVAPRAETEERMAARGVFEVEWPEGQNFTLTFL